MQTDDRPELPVDQSHYYTYMSWLQSRQQARFNEKRTKQHYRAMRYWITEGILREHLGIAHPLNDLKFQHYDYDACDMMRDWIHLGEYEVAEMILLDAKYRDYVQREDHEIAYPTGAITALSKTFGGHDHLIETLNRVFKDQFAWAGDATARRPGEWY